MRLTGLGLASALLSGICFATPAQAQSLPTPAPQPTPTPVYSVPLRFAPPTPRSPQLLEADRLFEQAQDYSLSPQESLKLMQQALKLYQQSGDVDRQFSALPQLSAIHFRLYQDQQAVTAVQQAISLARNSKNLEWEEAALQFLAHLYESLGNGQEAVSARKQALEVARKIGPRSEILGLLNLGAQYERLEQYAEAIGVYQQSLDALAKPREGRHYIYSYITDSDPEVDTLAGLINAYTALGQTERGKPLEVRLTKRVQSNALIARSRFPLVGTSASLPLLQEALRLNRELGDSTGEVLVLLRLNRGYISLNQLAPALEMAQQALTRSRQLNDRDLEIQGLGLVGESQFQLQQFLQAIETYQRLRTIAQEKKDEEAQFRALSQLVRAYAAIGQPEKAQATQKELAALPAYPAFPTLSALPLEPILLMPSLYRSPQPFSNPALISPQLPVFPAPLREAVPPRTPAIPQPIPQASPIPTIPAPRP